MKVVISGSTGLVGTALAGRLQKEGHAIVRLVRRGGAGAGTAAWNPATEEIEAAALEGSDAIVHLAGENIAAGRWTKAKKDRIRDSRVQGTKLIADTLAKLSAPPKVWVSASAIGFYGNRGAVELDENSTPGSDFLADVCRAWESAATLPAGSPVRVVRPRIGVVLAKQGGMLGKMLIPFKLGLGGVVGPGNQYISWISLPDLVSSILYVIQNERIQGEVNAVAPNPVTNLEFTKALGKAVGRPTIFPMPAPIARLAFGEMADALMLSSTRVLPKRLLESGFEFAHPDIDAALRTVLAK